MNTRIDKKGKYILCGSPGEARDVLRHLKKFGKNIREMSVKEEDKKEMGFGAVKFDISDVPRIAWDDIEKMAF